MARPTLASIQVSTPDRLLGAAEAVFAREGLTRARLADIAADAGITRASLLYHFPSKDQLHAAVVQRALGSLAAILQSAMQAEGTFADRLNAIIEGFHTFVEQHPALARILVREVIDGNAQVVSLVQPLLDEVTAFVSRERPHARGALMMVVADAMLHAASAPEARALWGNRTDARALARRVIGVESR